MVFEPRSSRSLLQRRSGVSNAIQAGLDGIAVTGIAWYLIVDQFGYITSDYVIMLLLLIGALAVIYDHYGIYRSNVGLSIKAFRLFKAWSATFCFLMVMAFLTKQSETYSRLLVGKLFVSGYFVQLFLHFTVREVQKRFMANALRTDNALIIGTGDLANFLYLKISNNPWFGERVVGCVWIDKPDEQSRVAGDGKPPVLGTSPARWAGSQACDPYRVPGDTTGRFRGDQRRVPEAARQVHCGQLGAGYLLAAADQPQRAGNRRDPGADPVGNPTDRHEPVPQEPGRPRAGRVDLVVCLAGAAADRPGDQDRQPGAGVFRQERMGWTGESFRIWKFRSMHIHPLENGVVKQAQKNDPRITKIGAFIRRTSLDELPQLFNVLTGEMSLVGPRPHALHHDTLYSQDIVDYFARHNIKPGMTGLAQVRGFRGETKDIGQMIQRVDSDIEYINNWSLWLDFVILVRTLNAFTGKQAY